MPAPRRPRNPSNTSRKPKAGAPGRGGNKSAPKRAPSGGPRRGSRAPQGGGRRTAPPIGPRTRMPAGDLEGLEVVRDLLGELADVRRALEVLQGEVAKLWARERTHSRSVAAVVKSQSKPKRSAAAGVGRRKPASSGPARGGAAKSRGRPGVSKGPRNKPATKRSPRRR